MNRFLAIILSLLVSICVVVNVIPADALSGYYANDGTFYYTSPTELALDYQEHIKDRIPEFCLYFDMHLNDNETLTDYANRYFHENLNDNPVTYSPD